jgi:transposase
MNEVITIGVDLAKNVFQVHGVDVEGAVVFRRQLRRAQVLPFFKKQASKHAPLRTIGRVS